MQYMVTGMDGKEYGPTDLDTLRAWVAENRLAPHTQLRDFNTGQTMAASAVPGLFSQAITSNVPPVGMGYPRAGTAYTAPTVSRDHGGGMFVGVIVRSLLGLASFFLIGGFGFIFAGYALFYAVRCQQSGSKYGIAAIAIAGTALALARWLGVEALWRPRLRACFP